MIKRGALGILATITTDSEDAQLRTASDAIREAEKSGGVISIADRWFGAGSAMPDAEYRGARRVIEFLESLACYGDDIPYSVVKERLQTISKGGKPALALGMPVPPLPKVPDNNNK